MTALDRTTFYAYVRRAPFGGRLTQEQVNGLNALLDVWERDYPDEDDRWLANGLGQGFHETGGRMVPVREGFAKTDARARQVVANRRYGQPSPETGHVYYGRGLVQLTWGENYARMGKRLGLPLYEQPDLALDVHVSARILFLGMVEGLFTGKGLGDYFNETTDNPVGARAIVNGTDKAQLIATYHHHFLAAIRAAAQAKSQGAPPDDVKPEMAKPDGPRKVRDLAKDKATVGSTALAAASGGGGAMSLVLGALNSPWALAGLALIVIVAAAGAWLYFSGRLDLGKRGGV
jgi:predicted chitinase